MVVDVDESCAAQKHTVFLSLPMDSYVFVLKSLALLEHILLSSPRKLFDLLFDQICPRPWPGHFRVCPPKMKSLCLF